MVFFDLVPELFNPGKRNHGAESRLYDLGTNGFASITWSLVSSLAPMRLIGLTGGVFNFVGGLGGITVPLVVGYLAQGYGFAPALVYISAVALIGALSYILMVGDVKRVG